MRFYYANQPAAILIGLLSVAIVVALAAVFLPLIFGLLVVAVGAAALFWAWNWLKVKMGWAQPSPYADFAEMMRQAEAQARSRYGERSGGEPPPLEDERRRRRGNEVSTIPTPQERAPSRTSGALCVSAPQRSGEMR